MYKIYTHNFKNNNAFTLIEVAIVLVIIAFIAVSVTVGQEIIQVSKINSILSQATKTNAAINNFRSIYNQLPGDFDKATEYWPIGSEYSGFSTADGNNDRKISFQNGIGVLSGSEDLRLWQHLNASDIISGEFSGQLVSGNVILEENLPSTPIEGGGLWMTYDKIYRKEGNMLGFASVNGANLDNGILTSQESWQLDKKGDDGGASTGYILIARAAPLDGTTNKCVTGSKSSASVEFDFDDEQKNCRALFILDK